MESVWIGLGLQILYVAFIMLKKRYDRIELARNMVRFIAYI